MRTMDRTYTAKMSWFESDRNSQLHDDICLYLNQRHKLEKMFKLCEPDWDIVRMNDGILSEPIRRKLASGDSGSIIGYADIGVLGVVLREIESYQERLRIDVNYHNYMPEIDMSTDEARAEVYKRTKHPFRCNLIVEVKTSPIHISKIIQQMLTYDASDNVDLMVLATTYDLDNVELSNLETNGITHIKVYPGDVADFMRSREIVQKENF